jgi:DNA-binding NarL/FixJ family response regulator
MPDMDGRATSWTVLVVDDHDEFRSAARALLESDFFVVVGEAADGTAALAAAARLAPDVVLLDVQLPDIDGFEVARQLAARGLPSPAVVLVSTRGGSSYRRRLAESPALGFLSKADLTGPALMALLVGQVGPGRVGEGT